MEKPPDKRPFDALAVREALTRIKDKSRRSRAPGMEAAKSRRIDRSAHQPAMDETDKEAARTLLHKRKRRKTHLLQQRWFQALALVPRGGAGLCALHGVLQDAERGQLVCASENTDGRQVRSTHGGAQRTRSRTSCATIRTTTRRRRCRTGRTRWTATCLSGSSSTAATARCRRDDAEQLARQPWMKRI